MSDSRELAAIQRADKLAARGQDQLLANHLEQSLASFPDSANLRKRFRDLLIAYGEWTEALRQIDALEALEPGSSRNALPRARCLISIGRPDEAVSVLKSVKADASADAMLGYLLQSLGRIQECREAFIKALSIDASCGSAYHGLGQTGGLPVDCEGLLERAEKALQQPLPETDAMSIEYFLGRAREEVGEYSRAWDHYQHANEMAFRFNLQGRAFDKALHAETISALMALDTATNGGRSPFGPEPLFVIGMMRSGTTLVEQMLSSHPAVAGAGELPFWPEALDRVLAGANLARLGSDYQRMLAGLAKDRAYVIDKTPMNYQLLGPIKAALPDARVVHVRRSPADTCLSIYTTAYSVSPAFAHDKAAIAFTYREYLRAIKHWRSHLEVVEVRYEDLVQTPEPVLRDLLERLDLPWDDSVLRHHENQRMVQTPSAFQVRQPLYHSSIGRWRHFEPHVPEFVELESLHP